MAVNLSIKSVPDELAERLRRRAERNHRSLQGELMAIIECAVSEAEAATPMAARAAAVSAAATRNSGKSIEQWIIERRLQPIAADGGLPRSVDIVRAMRDSRNGDAWRNDPPSA